MQVDFDLSARSIRVTNIIQGDEAYVPTENESKITISLDGLKNPYTSDETDSFQMQTFNFVDGIYYYYIDKVENGLTINSDCTYPCKTCNEDAPEKCLSCY